MAIAYTLWLFNIAMENDPFIVFIDDFPSYKPPFSEWIFHGKLLVITRWYLLRCLKCLVFWVCPSSEA